MSPVAGGGSVTGTVWTEGAGGPHLSASRSSVPGMAKENVFRDREHRLFAERDLDVLEERLGG